MYGISEDQALRDAGLDAPFRPPESSGAPLEGVWLSEYEYPSSEAFGSVAAAEHHVVLWRDGELARVRSVPAADSDLAMTLNVNGRILTGTWTERTSREGRYAGAVYFGAVQFILSPRSSLITGRWTGYGRDDEVNTGPWTLTLLDDQVWAWERWDRMLREGSKMTPG